MLKNALSNFKSGYRVVPAFCAPVWPALLKPELLSLNSTSPLQSLKSSQLFETMDSAKQSLKRQSSLTFASEKPAKQAKSEPSQRTPLQPISNNLSTLTTASTSAKKNVGGASKLSWFNPLATRSDLQACRQNLFNKIKDTTTNSFGCVSVRNFNEDTRPVMDKHYNSILLSKLASADTVTRYSPYAIAMMQAQQLLPACDPPALPAKFRQVTKRNGKDTEKEATWVVSHLCHNKRCVHVEHLRWEPSWMNRLRDNCPGGDECVHRPDKCLRAHRQITDDELINWKDYIDTGVD
jgi:hypothetical protein